MPRRAIRRRRSSGCRGRGRRSARIDLAGMGVGRAFEAVRIERLEDEVVLVVRRRLVEVDHRRPVLEPSHRHRAGQLRAVADRRRAAADALLPEAEILVQLPVDEVAAIGLLLAAERIVDENEVEAGRRVPVAAALGALLVRIIIVHVLGGEQRLADAVEIAEMLDRLDAFGRLSLIHRSPQGAAGLDRAEPRRSRRARSAAATAR